MSIGHLFLLLVLSYSVSMFLLAEACAVQEAQKSPEKLGDVETNGKDIVKMPATNLTTPNSDATPPVVNDDQSTGEASSSRFQPTTIATAIMTLIFCRLV
ncbi:MS Related Protein [Caenorhabditis elegans]|uniref:MS Related Protein n=1 Tax=Caenorhabditis elegans TaxID=6239 RepID=V6CLN9_CAEEL|nr:MS Related Protein [Caenorhabditis elegans]CDK13472.1 MS Related Protein [Caenorhabditis elegans]|eukprot:NP_001293765.1 Uncharacterized protein CELE_C17H12.37 [Caenorhabditis elegans]